MNKFFHKSILFFACIIMLSCNNQNRSSEADSQTLFTGESGEVKLVVLDPGHFHASLLQKFPQPRVNDTVYVYAPEGEELDFGGLLGNGPVMNIRPQSSSKMINRGGRIPAPMQSLKN